MQLLCGTVATVQNLNKRVEKNIKNKKLTKPKHCCSYSAAQWNTLSAHCSDIAAFYILRNNQLFGYINQKKKWL